MLAEKLPAIGALVSRVRVPAVVSAPVAGSVRLPPSKVIALRRWPLGGLVGGEVAPEALGGGGGGGGAAGGGGGGGGGDGGGGGREGSGRAAGGRAGDSHGWGARGG